MKLRSVCIFAVAGAIGLVACGSSDVASPATQPALVPAPETTSGTAFNDADVTFAEGMIPHHQQAIEMADIALEPATGASARVRDLATRIKAGQEPEIQLMTGWLAVWGQPAQGDMGGSHDMPSMDGMMSAEEMDTLGTVSGADFDKMWMEMMSRHHQGAIAMAQTVKAAGSSPAALALADQVIAAQQAEIGEMQEMLSE